MIKYGDYIKQFGEQMSTELVIIQKHKPSREVFTEKVRTSRDAFAYLMATPEYVMNLENKEMFYCIYLNRANQIQSIIKISEGSNNGCVVGVREVLRGAIVQNSYAIILSHNHPSGKLEPSEADNKLTDIINRAAETMNIMLMDHLIVTKKDYYSFADNGDLILKTDDKLQKTW